MDLYKEQPQLNKYISLRFISHVPLHVHICINTNLIPIYQYTHTHTHTHKMRCQYKHLKLDKDSCSKVAVTGSYVQLQHCSPQNDINYF